MTFLMQPEISRREIETQGERWKPGWWDTAATAARESLHRIGPALIGEAWMGRPEIGNRLAEDPRDAFRDKEWTAENAGENGTLTEAAWKDTPHYRQGIRYFPGMTDAHAEALAARYDQRQNAALFAERGPGGATLAGGFLGSIPDPLNFIPYLGPAAKAAAVARFGKFGGGMALAAADATIGEAVIQPLLAAEATRFGDSYDWRMAVQSMSFAALTGLGFGAIGGYVARLGENRKARALVKAASDIEAGKPVDVGDTLGRKSAAPTRLAEIPAEVTEALATPVHRRTEGQRAALDGLDIRPETERAARIAAKPAEARTPADAAFLKAHEDGTLPEYLRGLAKQGDPKNAPYLESRAAEWEHGKAPVHLAAGSEPPPHVTSEPIKPTTPGNIGEVPEPDMTMVEARVKEMRDSEALSSEDLRALDDVKAEQAAALDRGNGWLDAAKCLLGGVR